VGPWGIKVPGGETLAEKDRLQGPGMGGATALSWCGGRLCLSRAGARGLTVVEPGWNGSPYVPSEHRTDRGNVAGR